MRRREFIASIIGGVAAAWSVVARAQQLQGVRRVAILTAFADETEAEVQRWFAAFAQELRDLGWIEGGNIRIDAHWATTDVSRLNRATMELIESKPDVILANGPLPLVALRQMTTKIPIVFTGVADPVGTGFVASLAKPGGNITGFTLGEFAMSGKLLGVLKQVAPQVSRVTVIYYPQQVPQIGRLGAIQTAAAALGLQVSGASVSNMDEITHVIESLGTESGRGVIVLPSVLTIANRGRIVALMARYRLPAVYEFLVFAREGGLISYGIDNVAQYRQAASYVDRILKGANPAELPVQEPTKFALIVNLKTAATLGLTVPQSLLATADEVIE
jgi:putative tryptophan/tyrosine transport system substrate-binding protein